MSNQGSTECSENKKTSNPRSSMMSKQLTVNDAAEHLGVSTQLVYALCAAGKIVHERYGLGRGTIRISEEALEEYRQRARVEQGAPTPAPLKHLRPPSPRRRGPHRSSRREPA
jgi:excisionase family DNA binding protein